MEPGFVGGLVLVGLTGGEFAENIPRVSFEFGRVGSGSDEIMVASGSRVGKNVHKKHWSGH